MTKLISVIIPSYNDHEIIVPYYQAITECLQASTDFDYELVYVDDGSSDKSPEILGQLATSDERVTYLELFRNYGQQRALFAGVEEAKGDYIVTLDGDFQYPPEVILTLVKAIGDDYDMASGVRDQRQDNIKGRFTSYVGNILIKKLMKIELKDFGSVKVFSRQLVDKVLTRKHYFSDVYISALTFNPRVVELSIPHLRRPIGSSHWSVWKRFMLWSDLYLSYGDNQFQLLFKTGVLFCLASIFFCPMLILYKLLFGHQMTYTLIILMNTVIFLLGVTLAGWCFTLKIILRLYMQNISSNPVSIRKRVGTGSIGRDKQLSQ